MYVYLYIHIHIFYNRSYKNLTNPLSEGYLRASKFSFYAPNGEGGAQVPFPAATMLDTSSNRMQVCLCVYVCVRVRVCLCACACACIYIYKHTHTHTHAHSYTHTHI